MKPQYLEETSMRSPITRNRNNNLAFQKPRSSGGTTRHIINGFLVALIVSLALVPKSFAQNAVSNSDTPVRLTVAPKVSSLITMKALSKAICVLHAEGANDPKHSLKLFADDEGSIRFNVSPQAESNQSSRFAVDCSADGQSSTYTLELRPSSTPTADMPAPEAEVSPSRAGDIIRPALGKEGALSLSNDELVQNGYPVRPDQEKAPAAFATWLKAVSKPAKYVSPRQVAHPDVSSSNFEGSWSWSGFELRGAANTYDFVMGEWNVPSVHSEGNGRPDYSSFWIGLDGDGTSDLWQAGTEQDVVRVCFFGCFDFATYYAWSEFLPPQPYEQVIPNFTVAPGDQMFVEVWVGNPGQAPSLGGLYAIASVGDVSRGEYTTIYTCRGLVIVGCTTINQTNVGGSEAEWIMERPTVNKSLPDLANYGVAYMSAAWAQETNGTWVAYNGANNQQIFMYNYNDNDLLSAPFPWNNNTIWYGWNNFH